MLVGDYGRFRCRESLFWGHTAPLLLCFRIGFLPQVGTRHCDLAFIVDTFGGIQIDVDIQACLRGSEQACCLPVVSLVSGDASQAEKGPTHDRFGLERLRE